MLPIYLASPYYSFHSDFVQGLSIPKSLSPVTLYGVGAWTMWICQFDAKWGICVLQAITCVFFKYRI